MSDRSNDGGDSTTRRRTLLGLVGALLGGAGYGAVRFGERSAATRAGEEPSVQQRVATMRALASSIYPPSVDVDRSFVERQVFGRPEPKPDYFEGRRTAIEAVEEYALANLGARPDGLSTDDRRRLLHSMGATAVNPTHDGTTAERIRHYVINDLLYALFTSPASTPLTGIENPPGYPGGRKAYQRGPDE